MGDQDALSTYDQIRLTLSSSYYTLRRALKLNRLRDLLTQSALAPDAPIWLLGKEYAASPELSHEEQESVLRELVSAFQSIIWMTYRSAFTPIAVGESLLRTDAGWGCTLRSGQMAVAQGLRRRLLGPDWLWPEETEAHPPAELVRILSFFYDDPDAPLSIHALCARGRRCGVQAGRWLGPWTMAKAFEAAAAASPELEALGLRLAVLDEPGGAVPQLFVGRFVALWDEPTSGDSCQKPFLVLLVPLVLGLGKLNPRYIPQLQAVLNLPQSIGIVGGRPSSSLYFVGTQQDLLLYLDPHEIQEASVDSCHWRTHCGTTLRTLPFGAMDPSLALGFCVGSLEEYEDLCERLEHLEAMSGGAPLICITHTEQLTHHESLSDLWEPDELGDSETSSETSGAADGGNDTQEALECDGPPETAPELVEAEASAAPEAQTPVDDSLASQPSIIGGFEAITPPEEPATQLERRSSRPLSSARSGWEVL